MSSQAPLTPQEAVQQLGEMLSAFPSSGGHMRPSGPVHRLEAPIAGVDPLNWLRAQSDAPRYYWSERSGDFCMAGVGEADVVLPKEGGRLDALFERLHDRLHPTKPSLRYYGGFRFHPGVVKESRWRAFHEYRFVLPRFEIVQRQEGDFLTCNLTFSKEEACEETLARLRDELVSLRFTEEPPPLVMPDPCVRHDRPDLEDWTGNVENILTAIAQGQLEKVVAARETLFSAEEPFDALSLLSALLQQTKRSFEFCFHPSAGRAFMGASPERLYKRTNVVLQSEALAGTRPRGASDEEDSLLADELRASEKDAREHQLVVDRISKQLERFCRHLQCEPEPSLMQLRNCQHLRTPIEGLLDKNECDARLINALHPTPALGGVPQKEALEWIAREEPFDRGIYGAPVGWVSHDAVEFCVAIRCGLVQGNELALYSGAGIVEGSDPQEEWQEMETKMEPFLQVLHHGH
jgi:menaquinone-specific isochorismate synthase